MSTHSPDVLPFEDSDPQTHEPMGVYAAWRDRPDYTRLREKLANEHPWLITAHTLGFGPHDLLVMQNELKNADMSASIEWIEAEVARQAQDDGDGARFRIRLQHIIAYLSTMPNQQAELESLLEKYATYDYLAAEADEQIAKLGRFGHMAASAASSVRSAYRVATYPISAMIPMAFYRYYAGEPSVETARRARWVRGAYIGVLATLLVCRTTRPWIEMMDMPEIGAVTPGPRPTRTLQPGSQPLPMPDHSLVESPQSKPSPTVASVSPSVVTPTTPSQIPEPGSEPSPQTTPTPRPSLAIESYSPEQWTIDRGEGWHHQFAEIGIVDHTHQRELLAEIGPQLQQRGYAYWDTTWDNWGMYLGEGSIAKDDATWIHEQAAARGFVGSTVRGELSQYMGQEQIEAFEGAKGKSGKEILQKLGVQPGKWDKIGPVVAEKFPKEFKAVVTSTERPDVIQVVDTLSYSATRYIAVRAGVWSGIAVK